MKRLLQTHVTDLERLRDFISYLFVEFFYDFSIFQLILAPLHRFSRMPLRLIWIILNSTLTFVESIHLKWGEKRSKCNSYMRCRAFRYSKWDWRRSIGCFIQVDSNGKRHRTNGKSTLLFIDHKSNVNIFQCHY